MTQAERRLYLIHALLRERPELETVEIPQDEEARKRLLRALLNIREPGEPDGEFLRIQNEYLQTAIAERGITDYRTLTEVQEGLYLWRGDIATLRCGAIVNAANHALLGCFHPNHACIDNAIHTYAGVQLRAVCARMMEEQGHIEPPGKAKITPAFNLPSQYILHTVGPIVKGRLTMREKMLLADCYRSCLALAEQNSIGSVAFCCISTGEFHFPNDRAANIAVKTVQQYREQNHSKIEVIFNVFQETDEQIYRAILEECA